VTNPQAGLNTIDAAPLFIGELFILAHEAAGHGLTAQVGKCNFKV
jgi:hypothetical protein